MTTKIQELLKQQQESVKNDSFEDTLEISKYNESRFTEITDKIKSVINKEVWNEFSFGSVSGRILGILRTLNFEYKNRDSLCTEIGLSNVLVDMYYQYAGNAPYYSKTGEIISAKPMDIEVTRQLVKRVGAELNILVQDSDLSMISAENEKSRNESALQKATDSKEQGSFIQKVNINVSQNSDSKDNKHMSSLLDA